jgi:muramoyltetrapeptide carboxypeptidase
MVEATRFGRRLPNGGCIGVPAPASPWENRSDLLRGVEWWQARGYRVKLADGIEARDAYVAGDPKSRARDLEAMFADPEVDVVQCLTGGFGSMQLIPHLDFELIADHPKAFSGYSDITALHVALRQRAGLATFYGPHLMTMGWTETSDLTRERLLAVLGGDGTGPVPADPDDPTSARCAAAGPAGRWPGATCGCWPRPWARPGRWSWRGRSCSSRRSTRPLVRRRDADPARPGRQAGRGRRGGGRRHGAVRMEQAAPGVAPHQVAGAGPGGAPGAARGPGAVQLPLGHAKHLATLPLGVAATLDADARTLVVDQRALR